MAPAIVPELTPPAINTARIMVNRHFFHHSFLASASTDFGREKGMPAYIKYPKIFFRMLLMGGYRTDMRGSKLGLSAPITLGGQ